MDTKITDKKLKSLLDRLVITRDAFYADTDSDKAHGAREDAIDNLANYWNKIK